MAERYERPDWVRRLNAMAPTCGGSDGVVPIVADQLIDQARAATGIDDPGDLGEGDWEGRLRSLIDAINAAEHVGALFGDALNTVARRRTDGSLPGVYGDVRFADLMRDPVNAIAGAYAGIGRELTDEHRSAIVDHLAAKSRGKRGTHSCSAADWGFDADVLRRDLAPYIERFDVALED